MPKKILEIACFNTESCLIAQNSGASRIEFCANYKNGGLTPSRSEIRKMRSHIHIPLHIIIRPRGGNFQYSAEELHQMKGDILFCRENLIDGVVFGCLNENGTVSNNNAELIKAAGPMTCTFHRAIDECKDIFNASQKIMELGFRRILTSGGSSEAMKGMKKITELQKKFGERIIVMPGGGIRSANISDLLKTECTEFHSAALIDKNEYAAEHEIKKMLKLLNT